MTNITNPLLSFTGLPPFSQIKPEHVEPAVDQILANNRALIAQLTADLSRPTWDNLIQPLEEAGDRLNRTWSPVSHMNSVVNSDALRAAYNACLPKLSDYATEVGQNEALFRAYQAIKNDATQYTHLNKAQQTIIDHALRDFHLSGVDLPAAKKTRYKAIVQQLSKLTTKYEENLLDATHAWHKQISDEQQLAGLPDSARAMALQAAQQKKLAGWLFTLDFPSYYAVMTYADDRALRGAGQPGGAVSSSARTPRAGHASGPDRRQHRGRRQRPERQPVYH